MIALQPRRVDHASPIHQGGCKERHPPYGLQGHFHAAHERNLNGRYQACKKSGQPETNAV